MDVTAIAAPPAGAAWSCERLLRGEAATEAFGTALAPALRPGDTILLHGDLGAGKSALARAIIRHRLGDPSAEIPSPTYTLINVYEPEAPDGTAIWHADLYRLGGQDDLLELGLDEAFSRAICLVEWPGRLGALSPARALRIELVTADADRARRVNVTALGDHWTAAGKAISRTGADA
ncbi:MAG: tRNA (adenosine(37)-N6)-threonylcarbamoyltransferase complex ATPase subunit type 1 TsaE [Pseudomonadota bacterium]